MCGWQFGVRWKLAPCPVWSPNLVVWWFVDDGLWYGCPLQIHFWLDVTFGIERPCFSAPAKESPVTRKLCMFVMGRIGWEGLVSRWASNKRHWVIVELKEVARESLANFRPIRSDSPKFYPFKTCALGHENLITVFLSHKVRGFSYFLAKRRQLRSSFCDVVSRSLRWYFQKMTFTCTCTYCSSICWWFWTDGLL